MDEFQGGPTTRKPQTFRLGDTVRILSGPFVSFSGKIEGINQNKALLKVRVAIYGRNKPIKLNFADVENVTASWVFDVLAVDASLIPRFDGRHQQLVVRDRDRVAKMFYNTRAQQLGVLLDCVLLKLVRKTVAWMVLDRARWIRSSGLMLLLPSYVQLSVFRGKG